MTEPVFEVPEQMRLLLEHASAEHEEAARKARERWLERMKP